MIHRNEQMYIVSFIALFRLQIQLQLRLLALDDSISVLALLSVPIFQLRMTEHISRKQTGNIANLPQHQFERPSSWLPNACHRLQRLSSICTNVSVGGLVVHILSKDTYASSSSCVQYRCFLAGPISLSTVSCLNVLTAAPGDRWRFPEHAMVSNVQMTA